MGKVRKQYLILDGEPAVAIGSRIVAKGAEEVLKYLSTCPKCGGKPTWIIVGKVGKGYSYIYARHVVNGKTHSWIFAPAEEPWLSLAKRLKSEHEVSEEERELFRRLLAERRTPLLEALANAKRVIVYGLPGGVEE